MTIPEPTPATTPTEAAAPGDPVPSLARIVASLEEARSNPNAFIERCLTDPQGRPLRQGTVHRELQAFLSRHRRAIVELPRDHGKSVQVCGRILWELGHNPSLRVKLVCATDRLAAQRSRFLREAIARNPWVRGVFPHLAPGQPWAAGAFTIRRPAEVIGPSVAAFGVGAGSTGARADLLVCDDIVDVRALYSRAERERVREDFHNNLMNLLEPDGRFWGLCTPWHADDLNAHLKANPAYALFRRAVGSDLAPVWGEKWPAATLGARQAEIGSASFARGYRLVPVDEGEVSIRPEWVKFWSEELPRSAFGRVVLAVDPAVSAKPGADRSALVVLGRVRDSNEVRCLAATAVRVPAPELVETIDALDRAWTPEAILFEANAAFAGLKDLMTRLTRFGPRLVGVTQSRSKDARVASFSVPVQGGLFRLRGTTQPDPSQRELFVEMTKYPYAPTDDLLDAAATAAEHLWGRPEPRVWVF